MSGERIVLYDDGRRVAKEWERLCLRTGAPPHLWPGWHRAWSRAFGSGREVVLGVRRDDELVGVAPFEVHAGTWRAPSNAHSPEYRPVVRDREALAALARHLGPAGARHLRIGSFGLDGVDRDVWIDQLRVGLPLVDLHVSRCSPYVDLCQPWTSFEERAGARYWKDARRRQRRASERGELRVEVRTYGSDLQQLLTRCFDVEASGWKGREGTAIRCSPAVETFYREVADWASRRGWLRLALLWLDHTLLAFQLDLEHRGVTYSLKVGYSEAHRDLAPGRLLDHETLRRGVAAPGQIRAEWLGDESPTKQRLCHGTHERLQLVAYRDDLRGQVGLRTSRSVRSLHTLARSSLPPETIARARRVRGTLRRASGARGGGR